MNWVENSLIVIAFAALVVEVVALIGRKLGKSWPTISVVMRDDGRVWFIWPWSWGVLPGHWWSPLRAPPYWWLFLVGTTIFVFVADLRFGKSAPRGVPFAVFLLGIAAGAIFWAMGYNQ